MKFSIRHILTAGALSTALFTTHTASAVLIAYEGFDYDATLDAGDALAGANGGTGWTEAWNGSMTAGEASYRASSLSFGSLVTVGGSVDWETRESSDARAYDATAGGQVDLSNGGTAWFSMLLRYDTAIQGGQRFNFFSGNAGSSNGFGFAVNTDGTIAARITGNEGGDSSDNIVAGDGVNPGEDALVIGRLNFGGTTDPTTLDLWLNPQDFSSEAALGPVSATNTRTAAQLGTYGFGSSTDIYLRTDADGSEDPTTAPGSGDDTVFLDEIRIGTEFSDVAVIPEPSSALLLLTAAAAFLLRRRRRAC